MKKPITSLVSTYCRVFTLSICFFVLPINTLSAEDIIVVYPTGDLWTDAFNIQDAIDELSTWEDGGTIELKSHNIDGKPTAFNFGTSADLSKRLWVVIPPDTQAGPIEIRGEYDDDDNNEPESDDDPPEVRQTVIRGGNMPFRLAGGGELTIKQIQFRKAYQNAIRVGAADSVTITDNFFVDTDGPTDSMTKVIRIHGHGGDENHITGTITIRDNVIEDACCWFTDGISLNYTNAETIVANNDISGVNIGIRLGNYAGSFRGIRNNISVHVPAPDYAAAGVDVLCGIGTPAVTIEDNYIESRDDTLLGGGDGIIALPGDYSDDGCEVSNIKIKHNNIVLTNGKVGIELMASRYNDGSVRLVKNQVLENSISGHAQSGIKLWSYLAEPDATTTVEIAKNKILQNDLHDLDAEIADIELDEFTSDNLVVADPGDIVIDEGEDNRVIFRPADDDHD